MASSTGTPGSPTKKKDAGGKGLLKKPKKAAKPVEAPCPWLCNMVPVDVPGPAEAQAVLHPRKDVFVLKVAKVGPTGDRRCKMELELVTPKFPERNNPYRVDTKGAQCEPDPCCCCMRSRCCRK